MKINYVKTLLYAYPSVKHLYEAYSSRIHNKAHSSFDDLRPVETIADEIAKLINKRYVIADALYAVQDVVKKLDKADIKLIKHEYFGVAIDPPVEKNSEYYSKHETLLAKMAEYFEEIGVDDEFFKTEYLKIGVIHQTLIWVHDEEYRQKNRIWMENSRQRKINEKEMEGKDE